MSELARTIHQGTALAGRAYESAIQTQFNSATLKRQMRKDAIEGMKEIGKKINEYGTWKDAKEAEDEATQIENAAALGDATGDPQNKFVALKSLQPPKHFSSATLFRKRMEETSKQIQDKSEFDLDRAKQFDDHVKTEQEVKASKQKMETDRLKYEDERKDRALRQGLLSHPSLQGLDPGSTQYTRNLAKLYADNMLLDPKDHVRILKDMDTIDQRMKLETSKQGAQMARLTKQLTERAAVVGSQLANAKEIAEANIASREGIAERALALASERLDLQGSIATMHNQAATRHLQIVEATRDGQMTRDALKQYVVLLGQDRQALAVAMDDAGMWTNDEEQAGIDAVQERIADYEAEIGALTAKMKSPTPLPPMPAAPTLRREAPDPGGGLVPANQDEAPAPDEGAFLSKLPPAAQADFLKLTPEERAKVMAQMGGK
jgi:hypothetical protein